MTTAGGEDDPTLRADLLELYFNRGNDIWRSTRGAVTDAWGPPSPVTELNTPTTETSPEISADGLTLFFASSRGSSTDIWISTRALPTDMWASPILSADWNTPAFETNATPAPDGLGLMFARGPTQPLRDLWEVRRSSTASPWGAPVERAELSTSGVDAAAMLFWGGLAIIYFTDRVGGAGGRDLWMATRASTALAFDPPAPVVELNTTGDDEDPWISEDGRFLVFSSNGDLYETSR